MGLIAKLLSFTRATRNGVPVTDVKADPGGGAILTAEHAAPAGDDSCPLPGDYVALGYAPGTGRKTALGYFDTVNTPLAGPGEKRIYGRDGDGAAISIVWLKSTGEIIINNEAATISLADGGDITLGSGGGTVTVTVKASGEIEGANATGNFKLETSGAFTANGAKMTLTGDVVTASGLSLLTHVHPTSSPGAPTGPGQAPPAP